MLHAHDIKTAAREVGFVACGIAKVADISPERQAVHRNFLDEGRQGDMGYLERHLPLKVNPANLLPDAQAVICVALNYYNPGSPYAARFAQGHDYHDVMRDRLYRLAKTLELPKKSFRPCVDSAPIDEKYWAQRAGIGWQGRNSLIIVPQVGSFVVLGELLVQEDVDAYDEPIPSQCPPNCRLCMEACPNRALDETGLDPRKCLSYFTLEHKSEIPEDIMKKCGTCFYGCDKCAEACPHNRNCPTTDIPEFLPR